MKDAAREALVTYLVDRLDNGVPLPELAGQLKFSQAYLRLLYKRHTGTSYKAAAHGIDRRSGKSGQTPRDEERQRTVVALIEDDRLTLREAGERLGITRERVRQIYRRATGHGSRAFLWARHEERQARECPVCGEMVKPGEWAVHDGRAQGGHRKTVAAEERLEEALRMTAEGLPAYAIALRLGVAQKGLSDLLKRAGYVNDNPRGKGRKRMAYRRYTQFERVEAWRLRETGATYSSIARTLGLAGAASAEHLLAKRPSALEEPGK